LEKGKRAQQGFCDLRYFFLNAAPRAGTKHKWIRKKNGAFVLAICFTLSRKKGKGKLPRKKALRERRPRVKELPQWCSGDPGKGPDLLKKKSLQSLMILLGGGGKKAVEGDKKGGNPA